MDLAFFRRHAFCIMIAARSISSCSAFKRRFMCNTIEPCFLRQASWILNAAVFNSSIYAFCASACCAFHRNIHMFSNRKSRTIQRTCFRAHPFRLSLIAETYLSNGMGALVDFSCATNGVHSCSWRMVSLFESCPTSLYMFCILFGASPFGNNIFIRWCFIW